MAQSLNDPGFAELVRTFGRIGLINFGGPAGQIALMHGEIVEKKGWVSEPDFLHALNFCHLLPGPEAQQLATYIGWRLHGAKGGLAAGLLFIVPGALVMLGLSILYVHAAALGWLAALFLGIKSAVLAIIVEALLRLARRTLDTVFKRILAGLAFFGLFALNLPFPLIVLGAGLVGATISVARPGWLPVGLVDGDLPIARPPSMQQTVRTASVWLLLWSAPMFAILILSGQQSELWRIGLFFSQLAAVSFGGAYAVLAYMAQEAVQTFGWLQAGEMADGLGLAETTPGPLILVTQFVGFLAAFRAPGELTPFAAGLLGAFVTSWVTFAPCFLWIFTLAPWIDRLRHAVRLKAALAAVTASVVGVIANLGLWFAIHVIFTTTRTMEVGPMRLSVPVPDSFDADAGLLTLLAFACLFARKWGVMWTLAACAGAGLALGLV